jgi:hypothetical protein
MKISGNILKMRAELAEPVKYFLQCGANEIEMNKIIGKELKIEFKNRINCIHCGAHTKPVFIKDIAIRVSQVFLNVM